MIIEAVLFDMDGVLVDSEPFIAEAAIEMFQRRHGIRVTEDDFRPFIGAGENRYLGGVADKYDIELDMPADKQYTYEIYGRIIRGRLRELPGAVDFIEFCRESGLKTALATSADEMKMTSSLEEIGLPPSVFDATVNGLDIERKKPEPDIYIEAARRVSVQVARCLVVEDAINGVVSAGRAGAFCLGLTTAFSGAELEEAGADYTAANLQEFDRRLLFSPD